MTGFDKCKNSTVVVNQGSGVIIQPMITEYSYVLTAKHVVRDLDVSEINVSDVNGNNIGVIDKFEHPTLDVAIIKIGYIEEVEILKCFDEPKNKEEYKFFGYPNTRRNGEKKQKVIDLQLVSYDGLKITSRNDDYSDQEEIEGMSGGGVYKIIDDNKVYLVGVECRMDAENPTETHNHVQVISVKAFDEIVEKNGLAEMLPPYFDDFKNLIPNTFELNNAIKRDMLRNQLHSIARNNIINEFKPIQLFEFKNPLLVGVSLSEKSNLTLWVNYLEFLIFIWCVVNRDSEFDIAMLNSVSNKYCFLFGNNSSWTELAEDIFKSDLSDLEINGTIFVSCDGDKTPHIYQLDPSIISNISHVPDEMNIGNGIKNPATQIIVKHIFFIEKQLLDLSMVDREIEISNVKDKIIEKLNED